MGLKMKINNPEMEFDLPLKKTSEGDYIVVPKKKGYSGITITNRRKFPNGYIYFIRCDGTDIYKIGVSSSADSRIKAIDTYSPFDLVILSLHYFEGVYDIEDYLSKKYKSFNRRREWYNFDIETAKEIMIYLHNLNVERHGF